MEYASDLRTGLFLFVLFQTILTTRSVKYQGYEVGDCEFPKHFSINDRALYKLEKMVGKSYTTTDDDLPHTDVATYTISVCAASHKFVDQDSYKTAGAIQEVSGKKYVLGSFKQAELMGGKEWIALEYGGGQNYHEHCGGEPRSTIIMMICSPGSTGNLRIVEENNNKTENCFYLFELEHDNICDNELRSGLSIGSIVLIVFFALLAVYLIGGFLYQRFIVGSKGLEQIPNYHFWKDFGNLQADGCDFLCRCGGHPTSQTYRGIGDDQLNNTAEADDDYTSNQDDHLLPM